MTRSILAFILTFAITYAAAQTLHGVTDSLSGGGTPTPPSGCGTGVIDASAGCPLPMLGM